MSYEGHRQHLCEEGHRFNSDAYQENVSCPFCAKPPVFSNSVDDTNYESAGVIPEEAWEALKLTEASVQTCNLGHMHVIKEATYREPTSEEMREIRCYWDSQEDKYVPLSKYPGSGFSKEKLEI